MPESRAMTIKGWTLLPTVDAIGWHCDPNRARTRAEAQTARCGEGAEKKRAAEPIPAQCSWPHSLSLTAADAGQRLSK